MAASRFFKCFYADDKFFWICIFRVVAVGLGPLGYLGHLSKIDGGFKFFLGFLELLDF